MLKRGGSHPFVHLLFFRLFAGVLHEWSCPAVLEKHSDLPAIWWQKSLVMPLKGGLAKIAQVQCLRENTLLRPSGQGKIEGEQEAFSSYFIKWWGYNLVPRLGCHSVLGEKAHNQHLRYNNGKQTPMMAARAHVYWPRSVPGTGLNAWHEVCKCTLSAHPLPAEIHSALVGTQDDALKKELESIYLVRGEAKVLLPWRGTGHAYSYSEIFPFLVKVSSAKGDSQVTLPGPVPHDM